MHWLGELEHDITDQLYLKLDSRMAFQPQSKKAILILANAVLLQFVSEYFRVLNWFCHLTPESLLDFSVVAKNFVSLFTYT